MQSSPQQENRPPTERNTVRSQLLAWAGITPESARVALRNGTFTGLAVGVAATAVAVWQGAGLLVVLLALPGCLAISYMLELRHYWMQEYGRQRSTGLSGAGKLPSRLIIVLALVSATVLGILLYISVV